MNSLYIHVSNAVTLAATCDDTLLAYVTLDYTNSLLQDIYAKFNRVHYDMAIVVFDGRISHKQLEGCISTFSVVYEDKLQKIYGNVSSDDIINLYTLLKYMEIPEVYMYDNSVSVLSIAGAVPCIFRSYDCYILFDSSASPAIRYIDKDKVAVTLGELTMQGKTPIVFDKLPCADVKVRFKENFLTSEQRQKLHYFCYAMQQDPVHRIKVHANSDQVTSMSSMGRLTPEVAQPEGIASEIVAESAAVTISSAAFMSSSSNNEGRFRYIPLEKIDIYDIPDYCCLEMNVGLLMAILSSGEFEQEAVRERIRPLVRVNLNEYNKVMEEQGDILELYKIADDFLDPQTDYDTIIISPTNASSDDNEECTLLEQDTVATEKNSCDDATVQDISESDHAGGHTVSQEGATSPVDAINFLDLSILQEEEANLDADEDNSEKSLQTDIVTEENEIKDNDSTKEDAGFSGFLQSLKEGNQADDDSNGAEISLHDSVSLRARNRKLRSISVDTNVMQESDTLRIYGENPDTLQNEHFVLEDAVRFNRVATELKRSGKSNISVILLSIFNLILILALAFSFLSKDIIKKEYTESEVGIIGSYKVLEFFTDALSSALAGSESGVLDEINFINEYATIETMCVHENWKQNNVYCINLYDWVSDEDFLRDANKEFPDAVIENVENTELKKITIMH